MTNISSILSLLFVCCIPLNLLHCHPHHEKEHSKKAPKLIVVSFDGFRWDYLKIVKERGIETPNFDRMMKEGASIKGGLKNVFITKTFPNHYSIVTGRYEEKHGMVANNFFDPLFNETFDLSAADAVKAKWWDGKSGTPVEPIWKLNERCGCDDHCKCTRKSGSIFWPGSQVETMSPTYFFKYNASMPFEERVKVLVGWFLREEHPINFGLLYFNEPDASGHAFGPLSAEVASKIGELDKVLGFLLQQLEHNHLINSTDLIVTSDHGMLATPKIIYLSDHVDTSLFKHYSSNPVFHIFPLPGQESKVYEALKTVDNVDVYLKKDIPVEFHYRDNRRIPPILLAAHSGHELCFLKEHCYHQKGNHGFNNSFPSMHPIFVARGPSFRQHFRLQSLVENVDLYPLMATLLNLPPPPSDGLLHRVQPLLHSPSPLSSEHVFFVAVTLLIVTVALVFSLCACQHHIRFFAQPSKKAIISMETSTGTNGATRESQKRLLAIDETEDKEEEEDLI